MASKKRTHRRRRRHVAVSRRRRRVAVAASINPPRRRSRRRRLSNPARHHKRRRHSNPPLARGLVGNIVTDLKAGASAFVGGVVTRKIRGAVTGMLPATAQAQVQGAAGQVGLSVVGAIVTSLVARRFAPGYARFIAAGAWSEAISCGVAQTPIASYLGAYSPTRRIRVAAYPRVGVGGGRVAAYPALTATPALHAYPQMRVAGPSYS